MSELAPEIGLTIDGLEIRAAATVTIKEAAAAHGIAIPGLCHLPNRQGAQEPCRLCAVEADGTVVLSCQTQVAARMTVQTSTPAIKEQRRQGEEAGTLLRN